MRVPYNMMRRLTKEIEQVCAVVPCSLGRQNVGQGVRKRRHVDDLARHRIERSLHEAETPKRMIECKMGKGAKGRNGMERNGTERVTGVPFFFFCFFTLASSFTVARQKAREA